MSRAKGQTKRTPAVDRTIEQAIKVGATYRDAARAAGISEDTLARWRQRDAEFAEMLTRAEAAAKVTWLARIEQAGTLDWRALAWKLERRYPEEWARPKVDVDVRHSGTVRHEHVDLSKLNDAQLTDLERLLVDARPDTHARSN